MTTCDMAISILRETNDGNNLAPEHLSLVEGAVNGWLTEQGVEAFQDLYKQVAAGYKRPWFHGIEYMTRDHEGYVYWNGREVEHFSFRNFQKEENAAQELADRCRHLEAIGIEVSCRNAIWHWEKYAPALAA